MNKDLDKRNAVIDMTKFIMSILVVSIHVNPFDGELGFIVQNIIARIADPMFFILTSYFFFNKIKKQGFKYDILLNYLKRIGILYVISILFYSPYIINNYLYGKYGFFILLKDILFSGPKGIGTLWFLPATQLSIVLCFFCSKYLGNKVSILISFALYVPSILSTEYVAFYNKISILNIFSKLIHIIFGEYYNGLTFGFFFCVIGMFFSYGKIKFEEKKNKIMFIISIISIFVEAYIVRIFNLGNDYWALISLIPTSICLTNLIINTNVFIPNNYKKIMNLFGKSSVTIYIFHILFKDIFDRLFASTFCMYEVTTIRFTIVVLSVVLFSITTIKLSYNKRFSFLKYLY